MCNKNKEKVEKLKTKALNATTEDLFNDFYQNRYKVYWFSFVRGIFFGAGSVLAGILLIGFLAFLLFLFGGWLPPVVADFIREILNNLKK